MRIFLLVLFGFFWCPNAYAQTSGSVRSGEHAEFSRLVIYLEPEPLWSLEETPFGYQFQVKNWDAGFDLSGVFERIPKTRVSEISSDQSSISIVLGCDCIAEAFPFGDRAVFVDIGAGTNQEKVVEAAVEPILRATYSERLPQSEGLEIEGSENLLEEAETLEAFRRSVLGGVEQSVDLSLVQLTDSPLRLPEEISLLSEPISVLDIVDAENTQIRLSNAIELARDASRSDEYENAQVSCMSNSLLDIKSWGNEESFSKQISTLRSDLIGEFDEISTPAALKLVRLHLYFGLGVEAIALSQTFDLPEPEASSVSYIARILEQDERINTEIPPDLLRCTEKIAPWKALGMQDFTVISQEEAEDILAQFLTWPRQLRMQMGPLLVSRLIKSGKNEIASVLKSSIEFGAEGNQNALKISNFQEQDSTEVSLDDLLAIVNSGGSDAPEALAIYIKEIILREADLDAGLLELAGAFEAELVDLPISSVLGDVRIEGTAYNGGINQAIEEIDRRKLEGWVPSSYLIDVLSSHALATGDSSLIARYAVFVLSNNRVPALSRMNAELLAVSLLDFGLPEISAEILKSASIGENVSFLKADVELALGNDTEADLVLKTAREINSIPKRAEVMVRSGKAEEAWNELSADLPDGARGEVAWAAAKWDSVPPEGVRGRIAELIESPKAVSSGESPLLDAQTIKSTSSESRESIRKLLGEL